MIHCNEFQQLDEVRQVGSFKKGTMVTGHNVADIVVILKTLPTKEACEALSKKVQEDLKTLMKTEVVTKADVLKTELHDKGFDISNRHACVKVLVNKRNTEYSIHSLVNDRLNHFR